METTVFKNIDVGKIKIAPYNPDRRVANRLAGLIESAKKFGILEPLLLTQELDLVDGHRRLKVAKILKLKKVPCIVTNGTTAILRDTLYLEVNQHKWKISGADQVEIYKKGGKIEGRVLRPLLELIGLAGNEIIDILLKYHQNPSNIYKTYMKLKSYLGKTKIKDKKIIHWICHTWSSYAVRRSLEARVKPIIIINAIIKNKSLQHIYA